MSVRLTNDMRQDIEVAAVRHAFDPRRAELDKAEDALAREAYASVFTKAELDAVRKLPSNWVRHDACLNFNVGGLTIKLNVIGDGLPFPYSVKGSSGYSCHARLGSIEPGELCDRIQKHAAALETYKADRKRATQQVNALLASVATVKRLSEVWPEGRQFYARFENVTAKVPTLRVEEINAVLGLAA